MDTFPYIDLELSDGSRLHKILREFIKEVRLSGLGTAKTQLQLIGNCCFQSASLLLKFSLIKSLPTLNTKYNILIEALKVRQVDRKNTALVSSSDYGVIAQIIMNPLWLDLAVE